MLDKQTTDSTKESPAPYNFDRLSRPLFAIPSYLQYENGDFEHQGRAIKAWCEAGYQGILEMATGSGKTITAMICAHKTLRSREIAPYCRCCALYSTYSTVV